MVHGFRGISARLVREDVAARAAPLYLGSNGHPSVSVTSSVFREGLHTLLFLMKSKTAVIILMHKIRGREGILVRLGRTQLGRRNSHLPEPRLGLW